MPAAECANCGSRLTKKAKFCPECGARVGASAEETAIQELPPEETGQVPVAMTTAEPRFFGVTPPAAVIALAGASLALAIVLLVTDHFIFGGILLVVAGVLFMLFAGLARRLPEATVSHTIAAPEGTIGVRGGSERSHSVRAALAAATDDDVVLVHDAARPLVTPELVSACLQALGDADAAIAAAPVTDTIKECADGRVVRTLDRARLWAAQTPQVFRRAALQRALDQGGEAVGAATDDASLVEAMGGTVRVVPAPRDNLKVTTELDLRVAELLLAER